MPGTQLRFANHKNEVQSRAARTHFGELVVYQDHCENGPEIARVARPDPVVSEPRQSVETPITPTSGEHDLCLIFTAPSNGPLYVIDEIRPLRQLPPRRNETDVRSKSAPNNIR